MLTVLHSFTFKRQAQWLLVLVVLVPVLGMLLALVIPWLARHGWW